MDLFAYVALPIIGLVVSFATTSESARSYFAGRAARRVLAAASPLAPTSAEGELVRVTGVVRTDEATIVAPLSARPCVVARARVRIMQDGFLGIGAHPFETFAMVPFIVEAPEIGRVRVEGRYASLDVAARAMTKRVSTPGRRESLAADHGLSEGARRTLLFDEGVVEPGMIVSVAGVLMKEAREQPGAGETGYRDAAPPVLVLQGTVAQPLAISVDRRRK